MRDQAPSTATDPGSDRLRAVLDGWRDSLLDLGGRNRLLNFRHTRTATLELGAPAAPALLAGLARGWDFAPVVGADVEVGGGVDRAADRLPEPTPERTPERVADRVPGLATQKTTQSGLDAALTQLRRKSGQMFNDYGLWVLWLGVGMLDWREPGAIESSAAPLVLVPVELRRDRAGRTRLHEAEGQDPIHNPALAVKLARLGVDWSEVGEADCTDVAAVLAAARAAVRRQDGWEVDERVVLGLFASHREAMYRDLQQNERLILAHPLVRAVGLGPDSGLPDDLIGFEPPALDRIDEIQLPERTPLVLDADASQRQCIAAAMAGRSFVMNGPPGTGKSQTITNMIAALMHAGRSVLFVSEKAAALDVVRNRLTEVGLGDLVLALHSSDTGKRAVAQELNRVLTTELPAVGAAPHELEQARRLREELSAYAAAMNESRPRLGRSLHDVLGRIALLERAGVRRLALRPGSGEAASALSAESLQELLTAADSLSRSWRPVLLGEEFVWHGLRARAELRDSPTTVLAEAEDALAELGLAARRHPLASAVAAPRSAQELDRAATALRARLPEHRKAPGPAAGLPGDQGAVLADLAGRLGLAEPADVDEALALCELTDFAQAPHRPLPGWFEPAALARVVAAAAELREAVAVRDTAREAAADLFGPQAVAYAGLPELARRLAESHGLLAPLHKQYREDRSAAAGLTHGGRWSKQLLTRLPQAVAWQQAETRAGGLIVLHRELLGRYTPETLDAFEPLDRAVATAARIAELAGGAARPALLAARLGDGVPPDGLAEAQVQAVRAALGDWCEAARIRGDRWRSAVAALLALFEDTRRTRLQPALLAGLDQAGEALAVLRSDAAGVEEWQAYHSGLTVLARHGLDDLPARSAERGIPPERFSGAVELAVLSLWADRLLDTDQRLTVSRAEDLDARVTAFKEADQLLVKAAGGAVAAACNARRPRNIGAGAAARITREAEKKTRHLPVRELLGSTREVVGAVKPCFMMSPLTVSQFLPADYRFDVVIFDEASQVRPSDAVNCIYRGASLVVAGDEKQLPPTSFFGSSAEDDSDEYDEELPDSFESLLDACKAGAMRALPLRWHYRSRHEDLITFSNRSFYRNSMITFPGAQESGADVGVAFVHAHGVYDRGGRRDNRIEAEAVARRVLHHFDTRPGRSLGVVALSQAQASAIELAVQQARLGRPDLDHRFTESRLDGFFVKNLESVQGDERDVMIMSIGYGPDERGQLGLNFGPINKEGGWRRLNVAVTRARYRMEVVSSFQGVQLKESGNPSVQHLKRYLEYAEQGPSVLARDLLQADAEPDSPFEESVLGVLRDWGYQVQPQVGVAGFRIDLGVRHPAAEGSYALGIECDGAMYHSSRAARDRDRLREQVLIGLGWRLHRIWGTDWYRNRAESETRLRAAVESAVAVSPLAEPLAAPARSVSEAEPPAGSVTEPPAQPVRVPVERDYVRAWSSVYRTADVQVTGSVELHTLEARRPLRRVLGQIIETEGPIHVDLLVQRVREAWQVGRAGSRIRENIEQVLRELVSSGAAKRAGEFLGSAEDREPTAREPVERCARKVSQVPGAERRLAVVELARESPGMTEDELMQQVREFFGWKRMGADIREALAGDIAELRATGLLSDTRTGLVAGP
ncbi:hypothetical protein GCM10009760_33250 [Kitasatospora kazusensis]|uniref:AAA domain-containing protein n=1 Tax=Kitasatospora kazusensis TaxID=407974 RepID=A0ABN2ZPA4_9ACTN